MFANGLGLTRGFAILCALLSPLGLLGQIPTGAVSGIVVDISRSAIGGAEVTVARGDVKALYETRTGSAGGFQLPFLPAGTYQLEVRADGFAVAIIEGVEVHPGRKTSVGEVRLTVGDAQSQSEIETARVQAEAAFVGIAQTVTEKQIDGLPLLNRNPLGFVNLQAGVSSNGRSRMVVQGTRSSSTMVTLEGVNIQDQFDRTNALASPNFPTISSIQEFTVESTNGSLGSGLGASQINMVTPGGGAEWHGEGFWYYQTAGFDANPWFANLFGFESPKRIRHQFGANAAGPIVKDKIFVFGHYEQFRQSGKQSQIHQVLMSDARAGLHNWLIPNPIDTNVDPLPPSVTCSSGATIIPAGTICTMDVLAVAGDANHANLGNPVPVDPFIAGLLSKLPLPNFLAFGDGLNTAGHAFFQDAGQSRRNIAAKVDIVSGDTSTLQVTYLVSSDVIPRWDIDQTFEANPTSDGEIDATFLAAAYRWTPNARFTSEVRGGFNLTRTFLDNSTQFGDFVVGGGSVHGGGGLLFQNPVNSFQPEGRDTDSYSAQYNGAYTSGGHIFSFGWQSQFARAKPTSCFFCLPTLTMGLSFGNPATLVGADFPGGAGFSSRVQANSLLASLGGFITSAALEFNVTPGSPDALVAGAPYVRHYESDSHAVYFSDTWRVDKKLTLTYGARWEFMAPTCERDGLHLNLISPGATQEDALAALTDPNAAFDFAGGCGGAAKAYKADTNNIAPQVGIAYDVFGDGSMSIRAAYGLHYFSDEALAAPAASLNGASAGLRGVTTVSNIVGTISGTGGTMLGIPIFTPPPFQVPRSLLDNVADFGFGLFPQRLVTISPELQTPYSQQWNITLEKELAENTVVEIGYRGNRAVGLTRVVDFNQVILDSNDFLNDFLRARENAFICEAAGMGFNPACTEPGTNALTVFPAIQFGGLLSNSSVRGLIRRNEPGELAWFYHANGLGGFVTLTPNPWASSAEMLGNFGFSTWNAGVVELRRRWSDGIFFRGNYTFGKALTNSSSLESDQFDPRLDNAQPLLDKSRASFDLTHAVKTSLLYEFGAEGGDSWAGRLMSGWSLGSIAIWQSGSPFSILSNRGTLNRFGRSDSRNTAFSLLGQDAVEALVGIRFPSGSFPNILDEAAINPGNGGRGVNFDTEICNPFGPAQICNPTAGQVGNIGRLAFDNPSFFNVDLNIVKTTQLGESTSLEFRAEVFNFLNHPTFISRDQNINSSSFGRVSSTISGARSVHFGLRLLF